MDKIDRSITLTINLNNDLTTNIAMCPFVSNYLVVKFKLLSMDLCIWMGV